MAISITLADTVLYRRSGQVSAWCPSDHRTAGGRRLTEPRRTVWVGRQRSRRVLARRRLAAHWQRQLLQVCMFNHYSVWSFQFSSKNHTRMSVLGDPLSTPVKWAMRIVFLHLNYSGSLVIAEADTLEGRQERLAQRFLRHNGLNETSYLHCKSQERSQDIVNRLQSSQTHEHCSVWTEKFKRSFIPFSVNNYQ